MIGGVGNLVASGPLILAVPVALAAGAVTFLSPCCLPLVPGYLSYVTGMSGPEATRAADRPAARPGSGRAGAGPGAGAGRARRGPAGPRAPRVRAVRPAARSRPPPRRSPARRRAAARWRVATGAM